LLRIHIIARIKSSTHDGVVSDSFECGGLTETSHCVCLSVFEWRARRVEMRLINFDRTRTHGVSWPRLITDTSVVTVIGTKPSSSYQNTHPVSDRVKCAFCRIFGVYFCGEIIPCGTVVYFCKGSGTSTMLYLYSS
jgi:hypothetical protein